MAEIREFEISLDRLPRVLLVGNGINRSFGESSWDDVIKDLSTRVYEGRNDWIKQIYKIPSPYRTIVISGDSVNDGMDMISDRFMPKAISDDLRNVLKGLTDRSFDAILTTNYSYEIETAICSEFDLKKNRVSRYRHKTTEGTKAQEQLGIFKYFDVGDQAIWHIHGEAARPNSMVMGHYYYGKLLAEIQKRSAEVKRVYEICKKSGQSIHPKSWIDYFLLGDVYIIGMGLSPAEIDLWWLINCKRRNFLDAGEITLYEPNMNEADHFTVRALAETFGIRIISEVAKKELDYRKYYQNLDI